MAFYVALAAFVISNMASLPGGLTAFLAFAFKNEQVTDYTAWETSITQAMYLVDVPLSFFYMVPIAVFAAHRIERWPYLWIGSSLVVLVAVGTLAVAGWAGANSEQFEKGGLWLLSAAGLIVGLAASGVGTLWARRTQDSFVMRKLFAQLSRSDQRDLRDLVKTLPDTRRD
jgi:hypothetical protein